MTSVDIDQVENLKSVDMVNLVALFECSDGIFNHHTKCLVRSTERQCTRCLLAKV